MGNEMRSFTDYADSLLKAIAGRRCLYLANDYLGNVGDRMINAGTADFLRLHKIEYVRATLCEGIDRAHADGCGVVLLFGSGSIGKQCGNVEAFRSAALDYGLPRILLPSSAIDSGEDMSEYEAVFARDAVSQSLIQSSRRGDVELMPDMAHWYTPTATPHKRESYGIFLRSDVAGPATLTSPNSLIRDPIRETATVPDYVALAAQHDAVITNRLHFAIAALVTGRRAVLLPCTWHKTRSYYQTWKHLFDGRLLWAWTVQEATDLLQCTPPEQQE